MRQGQVKSEALCTSLHLSLQGTEREPGLSQQLTDMTLHSLSTLTSPSRAWQGFALHLVPPERGTGERSLLNWRCAVE